MYKTSVGTGGSGRTKRCVSLDSHTRDKTRLVSNSPRSWVRSMQKQRLCTTETWSWIGRIDRRTATMTKGSIVDYHRNWEQKSGSGTKPTVASRSCLWWNQTGAQHHHYYHNGNESLLLLAAPTAAVGTVATGGAATVRSGHVAVPTASPVDDPSPLDPAAEASHGQDRTRERVLLPWTIAHPCPTAYLGWLVPFPGRPVWYPRTSIRYQLLGRSRFPYDLSVSHVP